MRLCPLSESKPRKLHFAIQNYFGASFTVPSQPARWTHTTSFSSCCLQPQHDARKVEPSVQEFQTLLQFQLPVILAREWLDLQLAGKSLPAISAASEPFGQKYGCFPRFCFVPVPHWLLFVPHWLQEEGVVSPQRLDCCAVFPFSLSPQYGPKRGFFAMLFLSSGLQSLPWWLPSSEEGFLCHLVFFIPRVTTGCLGIWLWL